MPPKVTLQDIAEKAGVHRSTVSLALRDHPRISAEVRREIQALAKKLGYRVNPLVAALMQSRRNKRAAGLVVIAYVTSYPTRYGWRPPHHDRPDYFPGAEARAREFGYKLEHFWLAEPGMTPERFSNILTVRGINGVLLGRLPPGLDSIHLAWERFSSVALGRTLRSPRLHYVTEDHYAGAMLAMREMIARGFKRVGYVESEPDDSPDVANRWIGGYLREQLRLDSHNHIKPFLYEHGRDNTRAFAAWYHENKPDALLTVRFSPLLELLRQIGVNPSTVPCATLVNDHPENGWTGIHCDAARLGGLAVEMLIGLMHRGEIGVPEDPHAILSCGKWVEGRTLLHASAPTRANT